MFSISNLCNNNTVNRPDVVNKTTAGKCLFCWCSPTCSHKHVFNSQGGCKCRQLMFMFPDMFWCTNSAPTKGLYVFINGNYPLKWSAGWAAEHLDFGILQQSTESVIIIVSKLVINSWMWLYSSLIHWWGRPLHSRAIAKHIKQVFGTKLQLKGFFHKSRLY